MTHQFIASLQPASGHKGYYNPDHHRNEVAPRMKRESLISSAVWRDLEKAAIKVYGRDSGKRFVADVRRGEYDFAFASEKLLGVKPLAWQTLVWDALATHRYCTVMFPNGAGKTTALSLYYSLAGMYRTWADEGWGEYRMIHLAPQEAQSLQVEQKMRAIWMGEAREQKYRIAGGWAFRPNLFAPFYEPKKQDKFQHMGFEWNGGSSAMVFRPSTFKAKGTDGTDPAFIGYDELRHEQNFDEILNTIILPRFIRVPFGRLFLPFTPLEASVDLVAAYNRGLDPAEQGDWFSLNLTLGDANPGLNEEAVARAKRNINKRYHEMVFSGKPIQPSKAKFNQASVDACYEVSGKEPDWLDDLVGVRERICARCVKCQQPEAYPKHEHLSIGYMDCASSAGWDATVATVWDLEPPDFPKHWAWVEYIEELEPGTPIQHVAAHVAKMSKIIHGPVGYDRKGPLGHAVKDLLVDLEGEDVETVEDANDTMAAKDEKLDYYGGLLDLRKVWSPHHLRTKSQTMNYERKDHNLHTDYLFAQVGCAWIARDFMPDLEVAKTRRSDEPVHEELIGYAGLGGNPDPYFGYAPPGLENGLAPVGAR